jgi:hypothetical protein
MTRYAVAILLLALTIPAAAQEPDSANYMLPLCSVPLARRCRGKGAAPDLFRAFGLEWEEGTYKLIVRAIKNVLRASRTPVV